MSQQACPALGHDQPGFHSGTEVYLATRVCYLSHLHSRVQGFPPGQLSLCDCRHWPVLLPGHRPCSSLVMSPSRRCPAVLMWLSVWSRRGWISMSSVEAWPTEVHLSIPPCLALPFLPPSIWRPVLFCNPGSSLAYHFSFSFCGHRNGEDFLFYSSCRSTFCP